MKLINMLSMILLASVSLTACGSPAPSPTETSTKQMPSSTFTSTQEPALIWQGQGQNGCKSLLLAIDGQAATGPCGAPQTPSRLSNYVSRPRQWADLLARFAPFQAKTQEEEIIFRGQGQEVASPAWQRAISAWARLVQLELEFGRSGASWGAALSWRQEIPERPGYCRFLQVEVYGYAYASTAHCEGGDARDLGKGWLGNAEWEQFDAWYYNRAPVYEHQGLNLFSRGSQEMNEGEIAELLRWVEAVYARLAKW